MGLLKRSSRQREDEDKVRIDLNDRWYTLLMRTLEHDDIARYDIKPYVEARIEKDKHGYFLRLPYTEAMLLYGALRLLWNNVSNEVLQIAQEAQWKEKEDALAKFLAKSEGKGDIRELIEVFQYQLVPEEYHPFGPRKEE